MKTGAAPNEPVQIPDFTAIDQLGNEVSLEQIKVSTCCLPSPSPEKPWTPPSLGAVLIPRVSCTVCTHCGAASWVPDATAEVALPASKELWERVPEAPSDSPALSVPG